MISLLRDSCWLLAGDHDLDGAPCARACGLEGLVRLLEREVVRDERLDVDAPARDHLQRGGVAVRRGQVK